MKFAKIKTKKAVNVIEPAKRYITALHLRGLRFLATAIQFAMAVPI